MNLFTIVLIGTALGSIGGVISGFLGHMIIAASGQYQKKEVAKTYGLFIALGSASGGAISIPMYLAARGIWGLFWAAYAFS